MSLRVDGGGSSSSAEAQRRAEEARRRAEEARRRAEEARRQAEQAKKAAEEAQRKAAEAAKQAEAAKKDAATLRQQQAAKPQLEAAERRIGETTSRAATLQKAADQATTRARTTADTAKTAMLAANDAAKAEGKVAPYSNAAVQTLTRGDVFEAKPGEGDRGLARIPAEVQRQLGLTDEDVRAVKEEAIPHLTAAAESLKGGKPAEAIDHLRDAAKAGATALAERAILRAADRLPDHGPQGVAKQLLQDPKVVHDLVTNPQAHDALGKLARGDVGGAVEGLHALPSVRDNLVDQLAENPTVRNALGKVGLDGDDLRRAGNAVGSLIDAGLQAAQGKTAEALRTLAGAARDPGAIEVAAKAIHHVAQSLPETGAGGMARSLLTDSKFVQSLLSSEQARTAVGQLVDGKPGEALRTLASDAKTLEAAVEALGQNADFKKGLDKLGLSVDGLKGAADALPSILEAGASASGGDWKGAIGHLADAAAKAPELVGDVVTRAARNLPEGPARTLLTDRAFVEKLAAEPKTAEALKAFANGDVPGGLRHLAQAPEVAKAAVDALYEDPSIKAGLERLGLTPAALKQGVDALPSLVDAGLAMGRGDVQGAIGHLADAGQQAPELVAEAVTTAAKKLPAGLARDLLTDRAFVEKLAGDPNTAKALKEFAAGKLGEGLRSLAGATGAAEAAVDVLARNPDFRRGLENLGMTPDQLEAGVDALPDLVDAASAAGKGDFVGAVKALGQAAGKAPELVTAGILEAAKRLPDTGPGGVLKSVLTDEAAVRALVSDPKLHGAIGRLASGELSALADVATSPAMGKVVDALLTHPRISEGLEKLGLTAEDVKAAGRALPDLVRGVKAIAEGDFQEAFSALRSAASNLPPSLIEKAIKTGASHLSDGLPAGVLKSLLTDDAFVHELVTNPALKSSFDQAMSGNLTEAVQGILGDAELAGAASQALAKNADFMRKLEPFGIKTAADLQESGAALVDLLQAGQAFAAGDIGKGFSELGEGFLHLPDEVKSKLVGQVIDRLGLPQGAKDVVTAVAGALGDANVRAALGRGLEALKGGDVAGFVSGIADAGRALTESNPPAATALLNGLKRLPGSIGEFFEDPQFNEALVQSGAATEMFSAIEKMARGDVGAALEDVMQAGGKLLFQEPHFEVLGKELPFGMQGLENMARLAGRFIDMLPDELKEKIAEQAGKAAGKSLIKSIPIIGNIFSGISSIGSGKDLVDALGKDPKDWVDIGLNASQFALDLAGTIPGLGNALTGTLGNIVGAAKVLKGASDLISDVRSFQEGFVGF